MYTVGYAFFYGFSLITRSYPVLYVSLFAHFCQMLFLTLVEDPRPHSPFITLSSHCTRHREDLWGHGEGGEEG